MQDVKRISDLNCIVNDNANKASILDSLILFQLGQSNLQHYVSKT